MSWSPIATTGTSPYPKSCMTDFVTAAGSPPAGNAVLQSNCICAEMLDTKTMALNAPTRARRFSLRMGTASYSLSQRGDPSLHPRPAANQRKTRRWIVTDRAGAWLRHRPGQRTRLGAARLATVRAPCDHWNTTDATGDTCLRL